MSIRNGSGWVAMLATGYVLGALSACGHPAAARADATPGTLAWHGCWRLVAIGDEDVPESADGSQRICLAPGDAPSSLRLHAIVDDEAVEEEMLVADGSRRPVSDGGCSGWKRSLLSKDGQRLYLQSEMTCEGGNQSRLSGASLIVSGGRWVDINVARVNGERELVVRRYRSVTADTARLPGTNPTAWHTARVSAAAPLESEDVIEVLETLDPAVVEAMLVESGASFPMDSRLLLRLDDAGVPGEIIDLMMALSYPEYFAVKDEAVVTQSMVYDHYWAPWFDGRGYGHGYGYGYGYGYRHGHNHPAHRPDSGHRPRGKVVSGHGYKRVQPIKPPSGGLASPGGYSNYGGSTGGSVSTGSTSGSGGSASSSGYDGGGSTSSRRASPR